MVEITFYKGKNWTGNIEETKTISPIICSREKGYSSVEIGMLKEKIKDFEEENDKLISELAYQYCIDDESKIEEFREKYTKNRD